MTSRLAWLVLGLVLLLCCSCGRSNEALIFVDDPAALLSASERLRIEDQAQSLLQHQHIQLLVVVLSQPEDDLDGLAVTTFEQHRLGAATGKARGILLLFDPFDQQVRLEIGYDLEGLFTDVFISRIEREQMAPFFAAGRVAQGIEASVELLVSHVLRASEEDASGITSHGATDSALSGGAGACAAVPVGGKQRAKKQVEDPATFAAGATPMETLERYRLSLQRRIKDPHLGIYTPATRQFFSQWLVTDGQQNNALRELERSWSTAEVFTAEVAGERLAVVRFPVSARQSAPFFLRYCRAGWQLDFATMSRVLGFNQRNQWHMRSYDHPFGFAFSDWHFDNHGFPHPEER